MLATNRTRLVRMKIQACIKSPRNRANLIGTDGRSRTLPLTGGITLNLKVGDTVTALLGDHLEPGVSCTLSPGATDNASSTMNAGLNILACVGNRAVVISGDAKGAVGVVTGKHGGAEHVMVDFDDDTLDKLTYDDKIMIETTGVGLEIEGFESTVLCKNMSPDLFEKMKVAVSNGKLRVPVTRCVPAVLMGSGLGSESSDSGDYDIQTSDPESNRRYDLANLKLGDIVAVMDHHADYGWSYVAGSVTIGVIIHGDSYAAGHGPGFCCLMTSRGGLIEPVLDPNANMGAYMGIGRYRS